MEMLYDLRRSAPLLLAKAVITVLMLSGLFISFSFSADGYGTIGEEFSEDADVTMYGITDTLVEEKDISAVVDSPEKLATVSAFYDDLQANRRLRHLAMMDQDIIVREFPGDERFDAYSLDDRPSFEELDKIMEEQDEEISQEDPQAWREYRDEYVATDSADVKALQLNREAFEFYHLHSDGEGIDWEAVDFDAETIPVLLGHDYRDLYAVGDTFDAEYLFQGMTFEVAGFLEKDSAVYFQGDINFYLDQHIVIPYPEHPEPPATTDPDFYGMLIFYMILGDIAVGPDMEFDDVVRELDAVTASSGFGDVTLFNAPDYLIQFSLVRRLIEQNVVLLITVQALIVVAAVVVTVMLSRSIMKRRLPRVAVLWNAGHSRRAILSSLSGLWAMEVLLAAGLMVVSMAMLPVSHPNALLVALLGFILWMGADLLYQRSLVPRDVS